MPTISDEKKAKISEQILHYLFNVSPESRFTSQISSEIARDEEFTKLLLKGLEQKKLVIPIIKNKNGGVYLKRMRWRLSNQVFDAYSRAQEAKAGQNLLQNNNLYNIGEEE